MSKVRHYERDIFISYAHLDNEVLIEEERGWVSAFDSALQKRLGMLLARKPDIWRDRKVQGNDVFDDETMAQFPKIRVLVSIVSPRYVESEWCRRELQAFYQAAQQKGGVRVGNKLRIFKVVKTPVPYEQHPPEIRNVLGYEFYHMDETGHFREFNLAKSSPTYYQFIERFEDLAQDLCQLIKMLDGGGFPGDSSTGATAETLPEKTVYLAKTTSDLTDMRDDIRRDLEERGYTVLPDQELPLNSRFRETVAAYLARCKLSVHLIGSKYGLVPEDEQKSLLELQQELSRQVDLTRLIWMRPNLSSKDERQQRFIEELQDQAVAQAGTELLKGNLEELKTEIISVLEKLAISRETEALTPPGDDAPPRIYLIYGQTDREAVTVIDNYLYAQGFEVLKPIFAGDEGEIRELHQDNLRVCDAVLIYYNRAGEAWLNFKMNELRKAPGYRAGKPLKASAVYVGGEENPFKKGVRTREALVIKQFETFSERDLAPFVEILRKGKGGGQ